MFSFIRNLKKVRHNQPVAQMSILCRGKPISYEQLYTYTNGRFLVNEDHQLARCYRKFNLDALCDIAAGADGGKSRIATIENLEGGFSKALLMIKENGSQLIAKIPCRIAGPVFFATASEVGILEFPRLSPSALTFSSHLHLSPFISPHSSFPFYLKESQGGTSGSGEVPESSDKAEERPRLFGTQGRRTALLVTIPVGSSFQQIARAIGGKSPPSPPVDWTSRDKNDLPNLTSRLKFTTHYALCIIDSWKWDDDSLTLLDKFAGARFWDHPGEATMLAPSRSSESASSTMPAGPNAGRIWKSTEIWAIDSGQEIGRTNMREDQITQVYLDLRRDWQYMPVFWNCHDLAIRLAHLIIAPSMDAVRFLQKLMTLLQRAYMQEIKWFSATTKVAIGGWCAGAIGSAIAVPPLAAAGAGVYVVGWCGGFFGSGVHNLKMKKKRNFMLKLEERFPELKVLHR